MTNDPLTRRFEDFRDHGDAAALAEVFDSTATGLLRVAMHLLRDRNSAEDLVQQTYLTAIERAATFRDSAAIRPWLFGILLRHAQNERRRRNRSSSPVALDGIEVSDATVQLALERLEFAETRRAVEAALSSIESPFREVVAASLFEDSTPGEIASSLHRTPALVRSQLFRGLRFLRGLLPRGWTIVAPSGLGELRRAVLAHAGLTGAGARLGKGWLVNSVGKKLASVAVMVVTVLCAVIVIEVRRNGVNSHSGDSSTAPPVVELRDAPALTASIDSNSIPNRTEVAATNSDVIGPRSLVGLVLGVGRFPVANARVEARVEGRAISASQTDSTGRFSVFLAPSALSHVVLYVSSEDGRCTAKSRKADHDGECDAGTILLDAGGSLAVRVEVAGQPVADATVMLDRRPWFHIATESTDVTGVARFEHVPSGIFDLRASGVGGEARGRALVPDENAVELTLEPGFDVDVFVADATTKAPIPAATVTLQHRISGWGRLETEWGDDDRVWRTEGSYEFVNSSPHDTFAADSDGHVRLFGLAAQGSYSVTARADGYAPLEPGDSGSLDRESKSKRIELRRLTKRSVRFEVRAGEAPIPVAGTPLHLTIRSRSASREIDLPMGANEIVVPDVEGDATIDARAADGLVAHMSVTEDAIEGPATRFDRTRTVRVHVLDSVGGPLDGGVVFSNDTGSGSEVSAVLDSTGRAELSGLIAGQVKVSLRFSTPTSSKQPDEREIGRVELYQHDEELEYVMPVTGIARFRLLHEGQPQLPLSYEVRSPAGIRCRVLDESPVTGIVRVAFDIAAKGIGKNPPVYFDSLLGGDPDSIFVDITGPGSLLGQTRVVPATGGEGPLVDVEMISRLATLDVVVERPKGKPVRIRLERFDPAKGTFESASKTESSPAWRPNGPGDTFRFFELRPGRYRARDEASGVVSESVDVSPGVKSRAKLVLPQ